MKLIYWVAPHKIESRAYSIRARSEAACDRLREAMGASNYEPTRKAEITYHDPFELMEQCLGEGGGMWEES
jgi:hypothetical protein